MPTLPSSAAVFAASVKPPPASFAAAGDTIDTTAKNPETHHQLDDADCYPLALDVPDEASMISAATAIEREHGAIDTLTNHAGDSQSGAIEEITIARVRNQFETNVFGLMCLVQLVLPGMRRHGFGKIAGKPDDVARVILKACTGSPPSRSLLGHRLGPRAAHPTPLNVRSNVGRVLAQPVSPACARSRRSP